MDDRSAREIKIAYIGGGSRGWAWGLMKDLALCPCLRGHLALYDINPAAAAANAVIAETIFRHPESKTYFRATAERTARAALRGADVVAEFVPWYVGSEKEIERWGAILTPYAWRVRNARAMERSRGPRLDGLAGTGEEGVSQILGLLGLKPIDTNVNLPNRGQAPDLPMGAVVETYAQFRRDSVRPVVARAMPPALASVVRKVVDVQRLTLEAAIHRDRELAFQALLNDPLVRLPTDRAWKMFDEMLAWCRPALKGWRF